MQLKQPPFLCGTLFGSVFGGSGFLDSSIDGVDRSLLISALREILKLRNGTALGALRSVFPKLTDNDLKSLLKNGDIPEIAAGKTVYGMANEVIQRECYIAMLRLRISEAMDDEFIENHIGPESLVMKKDVRSFLNPGFLMRALPLIAQYGSSAKECLPQLRKVQERYKREGANDIADLAADAIKKIEEGAPVKLVGIAEYLKD